ncbi:MAG: hypothetical protein PHV34_19350 [Verrucomicrobiae bacterium]|nr:hypothetical protein [Verrucomicrobiae bacterium]
MAVFFLTFSVLDAAPAILPLKEVRPGMKGEGKTVFAGTKVEGFKFEVMGIARDFAGPGYDIIWCKLLSDATGQMVVAGGMSGSPCYVDGRIMGALAYGWLFNKEPIFGVQPIESMLELWSFKGNTRVADGKISFEAPVWAAAGGAAPRTMISCMKALAGLGESSVRQMVPLPLEVSGVHPLAADFVNQGFEKAGFAPLASGGGGTADLDEVELEPGAALTGVVARGDINLAATGTLTWRDDDRILAFGHPFLNIGEVNIPCGKAEIIGVVSSYMRSFKMSNKGGIAGVLTQDRLSAVGGRLGVKPKLVPMQVDLRSSGKNHSYKLEFCDNKIFTPLVFQTVLADALAKGMENSEEATLRVKSEIEIDGAPKLVFDDVFSGERFDWALDAVMEMAGQFLPLYRSELAMPRIVRIQVEANMSPVVRLARLRSMTVEPMEARAGDALKVKASFQPWHGERFEREFTIRLPEEVKQGEVTVTLADADRAKQIEGLRSRGGNDLASMEQLVHLLNDRRRHDQLYLFIQRRADGVLLQDQRLPSLPPSVRVLMQNDQTLRSQTMALQDEVLARQAFEFGTVLSASQSVTVRIKP